MKIFSIILRFIAISAAIITFLIFQKTRVFVEEETQKINAAKLVHDNSIRELEKAVQTIEELKESINEDRTNYVKIRKTLIDREKTLSEKTQTIGLYEEKLERARIKNEFLNIEIQEVRNKLMTAERKNSKSGQLQEIESLKSALVKLQEKNKRLTTELAQSNEQLIAIIDTDKADQKARTYYNPNINATSAKVEVNSINPKNRIVVLSVAPELKLKSSMEVTLIYGKKLLGKATIFKITDTYMVASLDNAFETSQIDSGSIVTIIP